MAYQFTMPGRTFFGDNALALAEGSIRALGKRALIVTGKHVAGSGLAARLSGKLQEWGISWELFSEITGEPTDRMIVQGVEAYREAGCDFLIGLGGGSPLDSAKAIAAMTVLDGRISDYMGKVIQGNFPPVVLIPTTAGTGSETTKFTIITDEARDVKMLLKGDDLLPDVAVVDASFTMTAPQSVTAATGMDALTHAVEAYTSRMANPFTDMYACSAVQRIFRYLPTAYEDGNDRKAREEMSLAAFEAGVCINNASVTLVHGMSRPIGALFHVPHGISNAMLIAKCLDFALDGAVERFAKLARLIGAAGAQEPDEAAARAFLAALEGLCRRLDIPTLEQYGINKADFLAAADKMAEDALASGSPANTIRSVEKTDILRIYESLW